MLEEFAPEAIHIATEGPLGRRGITTRGWPFSTAYHTKFPNTSNALAPALALALSAHARFPRALAGRHGPGALYFQGTAE